MEEEIEKINSFQIEKNGCIEKETSFGDNKLTTTP
jgi:hypothetical protein